jgi:hypothetical protein
MYVRMPKTQALREVMAHPAGHEAFVRFLRTDYADDNVWFYAAVEDTRNGKPVDSSALSADLKAIVNGYITPESPANVELPIETKEAVSLLTKGTATDKEILLTLLEAQDEALRILATGAFPKFLKSQLYADWRAQVKAQAAAAAAAATAEAAAATDTTSNTSTHVEGREPTAAASDGHYTDVPPSSIQALMHEVRDTSPCPALSVPSVTSPPTCAPVAIAQELDKILDTTTWLKGLLSSIEALPVCVSLAAASRHLRVRLPVAPPFLTLVSFPCPDWSPFSLAA